MGSPIFHPTQKNITILFLIYFRSLNKRIKRKPFHIPNIQYIRLKLEGFLFATSLDLNMGYHHVQLTPNSCLLSRIVLPLGKYEYRWLPMGVSIAPIIFQEKINCLFHGFEHIQAYLDNVLLTIKNYWDDHLVKLKCVLLRLA